jgi:hypothetical protein
MPCQCERSPSRDGRGERVSRGPICECDQAECFEHLPEGAWDDLMQLRVEGSRVLVVLTEHVGEDSVVVFRPGWTVVVKPDGVPS